MLERILKEEEGKRLECSESAKFITAILTSIVAFANTSGGYVLIGVHPTTKKVLGVKNAFEEKEKLTHLFLDSFSPFFCPEIFITSYKDKQVLIIQVPHVIGVYSLFTKEDSNVYVREGSANVKADKLLLAELNRLNTNESYDAQQAFGCTAEDLDEKAIHAAFSKAKKKYSVELGLSLQLLIQRGKKILPTNAGILLFGKRAKKKSPHFKAVCKQYLGQNKRAKVEEHLVIEEAMPQAIEKALSFVRKNNKMQLEMDILSSKDKKEYPPKVLREAITNAFLHADYSIKEGTIEIELFEDRLHIINPGSLFFGLTLNNAKEGISLVRNKTLAKTLLELKLIKASGEGLRSMIADCLKLKLAPPKFEEIGYSFHTTFYFPK